MSSATETSGDVFADLTAFQRDVLWALSHEDDRKGLSLKDDLEDYYGESLNHSRLYQNLDELADQGLITKSARDLRTNEYSLTEDARRALSMREGWQSGGEA